MNAATKFLIAELAWATAIFLLMLPLALLDSEPASSERFIRWLVRAFGLAAFPAGITAARDVLGRDRLWRPLLAVLAAASGVALILFTLLAAITPLPELAGQMRSQTGSWETRNDAAWKFFTTFFVPLNALLFAAIGVQTGLWGIHALPPVLRRPLYWVAGLGLLLSGYVIWDTTYEAIVLHAAADVSFAAFYTVLIPASLCAGLALPTIALLRRGSFPASTT